MKNTTFKEQQRFNDLIVYILLGTAFMGALLGAIKSLSLGAVSLRAVIVYLAIASVAAFCLWWLRRLRLKVSVNDKRIKYKFSPIHKEAKKILWEEVESCEIIKTPPATKWHGGNIRFRGEAWYSLNGRNGLSIETKDGRRIFIGCKNVDRLLHSLDNIAELR